ncbi:hypothetical protein FKW77_005657 [Venturia effusa]|uniref:Calpain catalytic domain-containing protein n=1 Tax=Venturia effusa TaxID=50376 RepID=A0A517LK80_9PEZI|nr:hypothetical protein FKW77_005657 [Venturia effusa]
MASIYGEEDAPAVDSAANSEGYMPPRNSLQQALNEFWDGFTSKKSEKIFQIFPRSLYANLLPPIGTTATASRKRVSTSYHMAASQCKERVERIKRECHRTNEKFTDTEFDIEFDLTWKRNCLKGLSSSSTKSHQATSAHDPDLRDALTTVLASNLFAEDASILVNMTALQSALEDDYSGLQELSPATTHRTDYIFEDPSFSANGFSSSDVRQGGNANCWWIAAVSTLCSSPELMAKICVVQDADCGVYGFVFYRDGEWISTVVDDNLYMTSDDTTEETEREYKKSHQTGSKALYFAKCENANETWLPLLEKAYAKIHGDYDAIQGGDIGEGLEDMTGGVTVELSTNRILSRNRLWDELLAVNKRFLFAAVSGQHSGRGIASNHVYSIVRAVEEVDENGRKFRLVLVRNPWGKGEGTGRWSDGSKEWTPYWMTKLNHKFGDDGEFWMSYADILEKFPYLSRTRVFDDSCLTVDTFEGSRDSIGSRFTSYFDSEDRKQKRSISAEIELEPGTYEVLPNISAIRNSHAALVEDVVKRAAEVNPHKLRQIGLNYDVAHAKGGFEEGEEERRATNKDEAKVKVEAKKLKAKMKAEEILQDTPGLCNSEQINTGEESNEGAELDIYDNNMAENQTLSDNVEPAREQGNNNDTALSHIVCEEQDVTVDDHGTCTTPNKAEADLAETTVVQDKIEDAPRKKEESVPKTAKSDVEQSPDPWNAVAVIGLRVYSKDANLTVTLVKPEMSEKAAMSHGNGVSGAGAMT